MKKYIIKQVGLLLLVVFALFASNTNLKAQTEDEQEQSSDYDEDESSSFFGDGINGSRFESNLGNGSGTQRPSYEYRRRSTTNNDETYQNNQSVKELDIEVHRETSTGGMVVIGSGSGTVQNGPNVNQNNSPSAGSNNGITSTGPTPKIKNVDPNIPDNPGDPDVPVEGGLLVVLGIGYGVWRKRGA